MRLPSRGSTRLGVIVTQDAAASTHPSSKGVLLRGYPVVTATVGDHVLAADVANRCLRKGVAVSGVDALIAAVAINTRAELFSLDEDSEQIAKQVPLRLLQA